MDPHCRRDHLAPQCRHTGMERRRSYSTRVARCRITRVGCRRDTTGRLTGRGRTELLTERPLGRRTVRWLGLGLRLGLGLGLGLGPNSNPNPNLTRSAAVRSASCAALTRGGDGSAAGEGPRRHSLPQDPLARDPDRGDQLRWELWDDVAMHAIANRRLRGHLRTVLLRCAWTCGMWAPLSRRHAVIAVEMWD